MKKLNKIHSKNQNTIEAYRICTCRCMCGCKDKKLTTKTFVKGFNQKKASIAAR